MGILWSIMAAASSLRGGLMLSLSSEQTTPFSMIGLSRGEALNVVYECSNEFQSCSAAIDSG